MKSIESIRRKILKEELKFISSSIFPKSDQGVLESPPTHQRFSSLSFPRVTKDKCRRPSKSDNNQLSSHASSPNKAQLLAVASTAATYLPSNEPFAERDFRIFKHRADGDGELVFAVGAPAQSGARLGGGVGLDVGKLCLVVAFALRADHAVFPKDAFKMFARLVIRAETVKQLNQG